MMNYLYHLFRHRIRETACLVDDRASQGCIAVYLLRPHPRGALHDVRDSYVLSLHLDAAVSS